MNDRVEIFWVSVGSVLFSLIVVGDKGHRRPGPSLQENFSLSLMKAIGRKSKNTLTSLPKSSPPRSQKHVSKSTHGRLGILHPDRRRQ